jgi:hypothetical protein
MTDPESAFPPLSGHHKYDLGKRTLSIRFESLNELITSVEHQVGCSHAMIAQATGETSTVAILRASTVV